MIVVERTEVFDAFGRSRNLVKGNGWQVFGVIVLLFIIQFVASLILTAIAVAIRLGRRVRDRPAHLERPHRAAGRPRRRDDVLRAAPPTARRRSRPAPRPPVEAAPPAPRPARRRPRRRLRASRRRPLADFIPTPARRPRPRPDAGVAAFPGWRPVGSARARSRPRPDAAVLFALGTGTSAEGGAAGNRRGGAEGGVPPPARPPRPVWLAGIAADRIGYVAQAAALGIGRLVVVQPLLASMIVFALPLGKRILGQHRPPRDPGRDRRHRRAGRLPRGRRPRGAGARMRRPLPGSSRSSRRLRLVVPLVLAGRVSPSARR